MHQYIGHIGVFPIRSYSILFLLAFVLGLGVTITGAIIQEYTLRLTKEVLGLIGRKTC